jgi:YD repeat-containing protein
MTRWTRPSLLLVLALVTTVTPARAQTTTYYLHDEPSGDFCCRALKTIGPDGPVTVLQSGDLKGHGTGVETLTPPFQTLAGSPNLAGTIPALSTVTFKLWMRKTANWGVIYPQAELRVGASTVLCSGTDDTPLSTSLPLEPFEFSCTTPPTPVVMTTSDTLRLRVGYSITGVPGNHSVKVELDFEGTGSPSYPSRVTAPNPVPPAISGVNPAAGPVNWPVTITGTNFGGSQGNSTLKFNGTTATQITSWSGTSIVAPVPGGSTDGPVTVTVGGVIATGPTFDVIPPPALSSITPPSAHRGDTVTIAGTNFLAAQGTSTVTFGGATAAPTNWSDTAIVTPVPSNATSGNVVVTVSNQASNALPFTVIIPGSIGGTITRTTGGTAVSGATVQAVLTGIVKGSATTAANGTYSIPSLDPATYDVRVTATGFSSELRQGIAVTSSTATTVDVSMSQPGSISGTVTQAGGTTPIAGAAVTVYAGPFQKGSTNTNATGNYTISALHPGAYTVQAANVGYRTKEQGAVVNENATTTANISLDLAPAGPVLYAYDALGRLIQVTDPSGDSAIYRYDPVGNITAIDRPASGSVSISGFTPTTGAFGTTVTLYGTGFSSTPGQNTVTFVCGVSCTVTATVTSATATQLVMTVPPTTTSGPIAVSTPGGSATSAPSAFSVTAAGAAPTITGFTPTLVVAGNSLTVTGTNFDTTPANDRLTTNVAVAQVTSATQTSLQAAVPVTTTGHVSVATQNGSVTSADYLWVAPAPYVVSDVDSTGLVSFGVAATIPVNSAGKIAMRAFEGIQGHRASVSLTAGTFSAGGTVAIYGVYANKQPAGFAQTGFLEPVALTATGTYTFVLAPNAPGTGSASVTVYDVPADVTGPIAPGSGIPISLLTPGRNARLTFAGTAGNRVAVKTESTTTIPAGLLKVLLPNGSPLGSVGFIAGNTGFLDTLPLPTSGTYTVLVDPNSANVGDTTVTLYSVPADTTGSVTINGQPPVPLTLVTGQNGSLTFTGTQNQQVTVRVTGNTMGSVNVKLKFVSGGSETILAQATSSGSNFDLLPATLPAQGTATYTITIDPQSANSGTLNINVTGS